MIEEYSILLRERGFRMTPQRLAILRILLEADRHQPAIEICQKTQQILPGVTEATVYRTLNFLTQQGLVMPAHIGNGQLVFEIADRDHHHLICRRCGDTCEVDHHLLEMLYQQFQELTGFQIDGMHMTFFGLCPECKQL